MKDALFSELQIVLLIIFLYIYFGEHVCKFSWGYIFRGKNYWNRVSLCPNLLNTSTNNLWAFQLSISLVTLDIISFLHFNNYKAVSHCGWFFYFCCWWWCFVFPWWLMRLIDLLAIHIFSVQIFSSFFYWVGLLFIPYLFIGVSLYMSSL